MGQTSYEIGLSAVIKDNVCLCSGISVVKQVRCLLTVLVCQCDDFLQKSRKIMCVLNFSIMYSVSVIFHLHYHLFFL